MKKQLILLFFIGFFIRFYFQFLEPSFNVDEISLGNNLKELTFKELLKPLKYGQSSPPLYLFLQKLILSIFPFAFWIKIKTLNFVCSILILFFFYKFLKRTLNPIVILVYAILVFNPFIIYNSLTIKQYGFDLLGVLILITFYNNVTFKKYSWIFFTFWCLISNIGLFGCAGFLIFNFFFEEKKFSFNKIIFWIKKNIKIILAPFPYLIYFVWYLNQDGASALKDYMVEYWSGSFIPFNSSIFKYILFLCHQIWISFYSAYEFWGVILFLMTLPSILYLAKKKEILFKKPILLLLCILLVHIGLNILHIYPLSDRLFLYLAPLFILLLGSSLDIILKHFKSKRLKYVLTFTIVFVTISLYLTYFPYKENDVVQLYQKLNKLETEESVYLTNKSWKTINSFNKFTENYFSSKQTFIPIDSKLNNSNYLITRVHKKLKPNKTANEESDISHLITEKKINLIFCVQGYNVYEIKTTTNNGYK